MDQTYADLLASAAEKVFLKDIGNEVICVDNQYLMFIDTHPETNLETTKETRIETYAADILRDLGIQSLYVNSLNEIPDALSHLLACKQVLGLDIETYSLSAFIGDKQGGLEPRKSAIRLVQFYDGDQTVYVFDIKKLGGIQALGQDIWMRPLVAHNAMFELKHLLHKGVRGLNALGCTLKVSIINN